MKIYGHLVSIHGLSMLAFAVGLAASLTVTSAPAQDVCPGDCNGDGSVGVNELITGVNIVLGRTPVANCPAMDVNGNGAVAVNELVAAVGSALNGCGGGGATFAEVEEIFSAKCATVGCHAGTFPANDLDLTAAAAYDELVEIAPFNLNAANQGILRVDPGNANNSFLLIKVAGTPPVGFGVQMPSFQPPLSETEVETIRNWINGGANP